jgi:hypothetical protein
MTPEDESRLRQLPTLIAEEKDPDRVEILAAELERLLTRKLEGQKASQTGDDKPAGDA